jgi:hypothetical protein
MVTKTLSARDASILGLIARADSKSSARELLTGLASTPREAARVLLGDIREEDASERARALANTARSWVVDG